jgi:hypothetical protein
MAPMSPGSSKQELWFWTDTSGTEAGRANAASRCSFPAQFTQCISRSCGSRQTLVARRRTAPVPRPGAPFLHTVHVYIKQELWFWTDTSGTEAGRASASAASRCSFPAHSSVLSRSCGSGQTLVARRRTAPVPRPGAPFLHSAQCIKQEL